MRRILAAGILLGAGSIHAGWEAGASAVDITPAESIWLSGYAARTRPSESIRAPIYAKGLALKDDAGGVTLIVTLDLIGIRRRMAEALAGRASRELNIPRERLVFNASHTHSAPVMEDVGSYAPIMGGKADAHRAVIARYSKWLEERIWEAMSKAVKAMGPATLHFEQGFAGFAVNRRRVGRREYPGPVDHDVPVLVAKDAAGKVVGILFGYACHNTVMGDYTVHGDYAGYAQSTLEKRHPGAVAMFVQGAGADQNPLPRRKVEHLDRYGATLADGVDEAMGGKMRPVGGVIRAAIEFPEIAFEGPFGKERWERESQSANERIRQHGRRMLARIERDGKVPESHPYPVQAVRFGDVFTMITLGGELVVDYALKFKSAYGWNTTWVAGYSNDVIGYIPSLRVWKEGGYEGGEAFQFSAFPGRLAGDIEDRVTATVARVMGKVQ